MTECFYCTNEAISGESFCEECKEMVQCEKTFDEEGGGCSCGKHQIVRAQRDVGIFHDYLEPL